MDQWINWPKLRPRANFLLCTSRNRSSEHGTKHYWPFFGGRSGVWLKGGAAGSATFGGRAGAAAAGGGAGTTAGPGG